MKPTATSLRVSQRGQVTLPAAIRERWGTEGGGQVVLIDLGDGDLMLPGDTNAAMTELRRVLHGGAYEHGVDLMGDPDLADH